MISVGIIRTLQFDVANYLLNGSAKWQRWLAGGGISDFQTRSYVEFQFFVQK